MRTFAEYATITFVIGASVFIIIKPIADATAARLEQTVGVFKEINR